MTGLEIAILIVGGLIAAVGIISGIVSLWLIVKYYRFNRYENSIGLTGVEVARKILDDNGLEHIEVKKSGSLFFGNSYSHYFKKVRLRSFIRHQKSLTSVGMGAQKAALAILDKEDDPDMKTRIRYIPLVTFGPFAVVPLMAVGFLLDFFVFNNGNNGTFTLIFGALGLLFYAYSIFLSILTLKTEKKAQERAYVILREDFRVTEEELSHIKELFRLYNIQYINDIVLSSLELLYTLLQIANALQGNSSN